MNLFQNLGLSIEQIINAIRQTGTSDKIAELMVLFSIIITLVIMYKGYEVLMGKSQSPVRELTWDIAGKLLAITFALNLGGWLDLVIGAMDGIYEWAGGGAQMYQNLDEMFANTSQLTDAIWKKSSGVGDSILAVVAMCLCYMGFAISVIPTLAILIVTTFTQTLLVISAPIVFWLLVFKATRNVFTQWIGLLLSNTLVLLLVGLFLKTFMGEISGWISILSSETQTGTEVLGTSIFYVIASLILVIMIFSAKIFAEKVANVSMEGAMGAAMSSVLSPAGQLAMKPAGKAAGMAMNYGKAGGKLATKGAWAVGKGLGKGGYSLAKKMYERARNEA
ncbi:type IV secretion system protein [Campylobacter upsaliensis]|uniref:type IV secretion system protein n=1 Tax=Campylobacter upsaliensis TaxID=28080 RepID=UPI0012D04BA5|nr:type IV secretion system protein [Campylobacter upsaliensis]EAI7243174.1 type IV secretion system protein [Campylobacter upsaliensis]EAI8053160.1 type IV secretion system protein [Campylobacter upsaliensis]EAI8667407.1 type IV secretion system protein [Campylobacter upsaliensis]EAJ0469152.1 type IV secretion system protein [Campylobacter upsaliensis]EAJ0669243.1 type IV secretion system protein [Campylobacter upsaliensis]